MLGLFRIAPRIVLITVLSLPGKLNLISIAPAVFAFLRAARRTGEVVGGNDETTQSEQSTPMVQSPFFCTAFRGKHIAWSHC
jgi:hypothetical protein